MSRWVGAHGKISLAGFSYNVGATYAGEPVEVVVATGLVDILHAGVVVATHAQRVREDQADRLPRAPVARRARKGLRASLGYDSQQRAATVRGLPSDAHPVRRFTHPRQFSFGRVP